MNHYDQIIGDALPDWTPSQLPQNVVLTGRYCRLEPLSVLIHSDQLFEAFALSSDDRDWTYMPVGPFNTRIEYGQYVVHAARSFDPKHFAVVEIKSGKAVGTLSLMRIKSIHGVVEVGHVAFSSLLRRTIASTEAQFLLMSYVFEDLKYRRYEWKCDSLNTQSRTAAERLGFQFEGVFKQAMVYKGRNRDTAWYATTDKEWPLLQQAFQAWLSDSNFDAHGRQLKSLRAFREVLS